MFLLNICIRLYQYIYIIIYIYCMRYFHTCFNPVKWYELSEFVYRTFQTTWLRIRLVSAHLRSFAVASPQRGRHPSVKLSSGHPHAWLPQDAFQLLCFLVTVFTWNLTCHGLLESLQANNQQINSDAFYIPQAVG